MLGMDLNLSLTNIGASSSLASEVVLLAMLLCSLGFNTVISAGNGMSL